MAQVDTLSKLVSLDFEKKIMVLSLDFLTPDIIAELQDLFESDLSIKHSFKSIKKSKPVTKKQRGQFWVDHHKIMRALKIPINKKNSDVFYNEVVKPNIFPTQHHVLGDQIIPYILDMKDLDLEKMVEVIQRQRDFYDYLNINWDLL